MNVLKSSFIIRNPFFNKSSHWFFITIGVLETGRKEITVLSPRLPDFLTHKFRNRLIYFLLKKEQIREKHTAR